MNKLLLFSGKNLIFVDNEHNYYLYDREINKILWRQKITRTSEAFEKYACQLDKNIFLIANSLGQVQVLNKSGEQIGKIKSEKRISTNISKIGNLIVYGNKSQIQAFRFYN